MKCNSFGRCGSCVLYEEGYEKQLETKKEKVSELLSPFGDVELEIFDSNHSHYRARAEFRIWHDNGVCSYAMGDVDRKGYINISECPKVIEVIENKQWKLLELINQNKSLSHKLFGVEFLGTSSGELLVTMLYHRKLDDEWIELARDIEEALDLRVVGRSRKQKIVVSAEYVTERLSVDNRVYSYRYYEAGFTQPNSGVNVKMIEWAKGCASHANSGDFLESYCGLGNFTLPLSGLFTKVLATEISKSSIKAAKENCEINDIDNIVFARLSSSEMTEALSGVRKFRRLEKINLDSYNFSCVLVDPPRAGLDEETRGLISKIDHIIYISCNPETLVRDLVELTSTHKVVKSAIFDQFPYTNHVESGVFLVRK